jgi:phytol kinase
MTLLTILILTGLLLLWNLFVIHFLTKWAYGFVRKLKDIPAEYIGRKIIHMFCGGIIALLIPVFYEGYYEFVILSAYGLGAYLLFWRKYKLLYWFQVKENMYEVHFTIAYGTTLLIGILLQNVMIGLISLLFMSFGDSATGLVRAITQKKQVKSWDGSLAMFLICSIIGYLFLGTYGIMVGAVATLVEKIPGIDDNITVPLVTALLVYVHGVIV